MYPNNCVLLLMIFSLFSQIGLQAQTDNGPTLTDPRDGQTYRIKTFTKVLPYDIPVAQTWMIDNLNYQAAESWCYDEDEKNCAEYGRLYSWEAAKSACPEGWHLPTDVATMTHQFDENGFSIT